MFEALTNNQTLHSWTLHSNYVMHKAHMATLFPQLNSQLHDALKIHEIAHSNYIGFVLFAMMNNNQ